MLFMLMGLPLEALTLRRQKRCHAVLKWKLWLLMRAGFLLPCKKSGDTEVLVNSENERATV